MYKYKNISGLEQTIIGVGCVPAGAVFTSVVPINNPNFQPVSNTVEPAPVEELKESE